MEFNDKRILFLKQSSLGDVIHALPLAHALKRCAPTCHLGWVIEQGLAPLLYRDTSVDSVHPIHIPSTSSPNARWSAYPQASAAMMHTCQRLRAVFHHAPYDYVLDLHASFRSGLFALMNPGGQRIGFADARELNPLFQHRLVRVPHKIQHAVEKNILLSQKIGSPIRDEDFFLATNSEDAQEAEQFLRRSAVMGAMRFVYVNPCARWQSKFWLAERWSALCDRLMQNGIAIIFGGSPDERGYIKRIVARMKYPGVIAAGELPLTGAVALMKRASVYVGLDTGPMHMAAMAGTPVVALFGPTHPERVGPYNVTSRVVQAKNMDCLCCRKRECNELHCMEGITVDAVYDDVMQLLSMSQNV